MNAPATPFQHLGTRHIAALNLDVEEYRHAVTGAQHIHLASQSNENVFLVALRTVPKDSKGVAHILEHTALCGSEKYPVRDPFFMMIRRSLNTFMNAFTSSDWTAYPFASMDRADFSNLLKVYMDAVFFPKLNQLDFLQEGHRLEFSEADNPNSSLELKGIVFNEMKGAMSSPVSILWHTLCKYLYPETTYHFNSGGDPEVIPELTYQELKDFHSTHYHPSNAIFMTFGDIPAAQHQADFEALALNRFEKNEAHIAVNRVPRFTSPIAVEEPYPITEAEADEDRTHVVLGWLLGESTDLETVMEAQLLSSVLLDNSASPLLQALETTDLGRAPSPLCGLDDSQREMCFVCGLEGVTRDGALAVETLILNTLERVANEGVDPAQVEACLLQLELQQREISGDTYPYGLQLILSALGSATHRGDPVELLDIEPVLATLREKIQAPDYIKSLCATLLLNNSHRVRLTLQPDTQLAQNKLNEERARVAAIEANLSAADKQHIVAQTKALAERQAQQDDPNVLPKIDLADVAKVGPYTNKHSVVEQPVHITRYAAGTNGLTYQYLIAPLPQLNRDELMLLPALTHFLTELGVGDQTYLQAQQQQAQVCGAVSARHSLRALPDNAQDVRGYFVLSSKALYRNQSAAADMMLNTFENCRFDERERVRDLIAQSRARSESSITGSGHSLAMTAAAQHFNPVNYFSHHVGGLAGIRALKAKDESLSDPQTLQQFLADLAQLHQKLCDMPRQLLLINEAEMLEGFSDYWLSKPWPQAEQNLATLQLPPMQPKAANELWVGNTQVHFCARAYPTVPTAHPDAAPLTVLGGYLRNNFLHRSIREQGGAYGGGASQDNNGGVFRFYSYRDPRLAETLSDFDRSLQWLAQDKGDPRLLEEAILGVVASLDKPGSPAGDANNTFMSELFGRSSETRNQFRQRALNTTYADLQRVVSTYLTAENASTAVVSHADSKAQAKQLGLTIQTL